MSLEQEPARPALPVTGIYINLRDRAIEFENQWGTIGRIIFAGETVLFEGQPFTLPAAVAETDSASAPAPAPVASHEAGAAAATPAAPDAREKQPTAVLSGRLLTQPAAGKPDSRGKPTAWARFAAHEEGSAEAHLYSATFHRHTAAIALGLPKGSQVTVEGYAHARANVAGKRLDTFSVINVVAYPGKPEQSPRRSRRRS